MNKKKFVTFIIILLIILFALFIVFSFIPQKNIFENIYANIFSRLSGAQPQGTGGAQRGVGENRGGSGAPAQQQGAGGAQRNVAGRDGTRNAAAIRTVTVAPGTIEKSVIINGEILARNQVTIYPTVGGRLVECNYSVGDRVVRGAVVARVDPVKTR